MNTSEYLRRDGHMVVLLAVWLQACGVHDGLHSGSRPTFTSDEQSIVVALNARGHSEVMLFPRTGGRGTTLSRSFDAVEPAVSADGKTIAFIARESGSRGRVWVGDLATQSYRPTEGLNGGPSMAALPVFLADGRLVYFRSAEHRTTSTFGSAWVNWNMYLWNPKTGRSELATAQRYWRLNGAGACRALLLAGRSDSDHPSVQRFDFSLSDSAAAGREWSGVSDPSPFSDCSKFVSVARMGESDATGYFEYELVVRNSDSDEGMQLTRLGSYIASPSVAPSGESVLFLSDRQRSDTFELIELTLKTGQSRRIELIW